MFDDRRFILSHIRHSFITCDDTGVCELAMLNEVMPHHLPNEPDQDLLDSKSRTKKGRTQRMFVCLFEFSFLVVWRAFHHLSCETCRYLFVTLPVFFVEVVCNFLSSNASSFNFLYFSFLRHISWNKIRAGRSPVLWHPVWHGNDRRP